MKIIVIADDESGINSLPACKADVLLSLGDLSDRSIARAMEKYQPEKTYLVRGSHDLDHAELPQGMIAIHENIEEFKGVTFGGFNGCWRYKEWGPYLHSQEEAENILRNFPRVDVFIAHSSPYGMHERDQENNQGLKALEKYILEKKPGAFFHGQQHWNKRSLLGETTVIGVYGAILIEITDS